MSKNPEAAACYQTAAVLVGLAELAVLLSIFLVPETLQEQRMVSTNLFALMYYKVCATILVVLQLLFVVLYLMRFRLVARVWTAVACLLTSCALIGWTITISCDPDTDMMNHSIGAGIFVTGTAGYFAILLTLTYHFDSPQNRRYDLMAYAVTLAAGVFTLLFVILYFSSAEWAWLFENIAFILMAAGYVVFFWFHTFDPKDPVPPRPPPVQCRPLLAPHTVPDVDAFY
jgi:hypothetical protein